MALAPNNSAFPSENVPAKDKEKKPWLLQSARASYTNYCAYPAGTFGWLSSSFYGVMKSYTMADQPITQTKKITSLDQDPNNNNMVSNWKVLAVIPKLRRIGINKTLELGYKIKIDAVNPLAVEENKDVYAKAQAKIHLRDAMRAAGQQQMLQTPALAIRPGDPDDLRSLDMSMLGYRHQVALAAELLTTQAFNQSDWDFTYEQGVEDMFDAGFAVTKGDVCDGMAKLSRVDPERFIPAPFMNADASDMFAAGEVMAMPVAKLLEESNGQITDADVQKLYDIAKNGSISTPGTMGYTNGYTSLADFHLRGTVNVYFYQVESSSVLLRENGVDDLGNKRSRPRKFGTTQDQIDKEAAKAGKEPGQLVSRYVRNVFTCKWVVGTEIVYDCGKMPGDKLSYQFVAPQFYKMKVYSRLKVMITHDENVQMYNAKMQNALNTIIPDGVEIDIAALEDVSIGAGDQKIGVMELLNMFLEKRVLLARRNNPYQAAGTQPMAAIREIKAGNFAEVAMYFNQMKEEINLMRDAIGLNEITDGSTPNPKNLNSTNNAAIQSTNAAFSDMYRSAKRMTKLCTQVAMTLMQWLARQGKTEKLVSQLGSNVVNTLKGLPDLSLYEFGYEIEDEPSDQEVADFVKVLELSIGKDEITSKDVLMLSTLPNLKLKIEYLSQAIDKNKQEAQAQAQQLQEQNGQIQQQSAQAAEQAKQQTLQMQHQFKMEELQLQHQLNMEAQDPKLHVDLIKEVIKSEGYTNAAAISADAKTTTSKDNLVGKMHGDLLDHHENQSKLATTIATANQSIEALGNQTETSAGSAAPITGQTMQDLMPQQSPQPDPTQGPSVAPPQGQPQQSAYSFLKPQQMNQPMPQSLGLHEPEQ